MKILDVFPVDPLTEMFLFCSVGKIGLLSKPKHENDVYRGIAAKCLGKNGTPFVDGLTQEAHGTRLTRVQTLQSLHTCRENGVDFRLCLDALN